MSSAVSLKIKLGGKKTSPRGPPRTPSKARFTGHPAPRLHLGPPASRNPERDVLGLGRLLGLQTTASSLCYSPRLPDQTQDIISLLLFVRKTWWSWRKYGNKWTAHPFVTSKTGSSKPTQADFMHHILTNVGGNFCIFSAYCHYTTKIFMGGKQGTVLCSELSHHPPGQLVWVPFVLLLIQVPVNVPGTTTDCPSTWAPSAAQGSS